MARKEKLESLQQLRQEGEEEEVKEIRPPQTKVQKVALRVSCVFCSMPLGFAYSGSPFDGFSPSSSLPSELSGV